MARDRPVTDDDVEALREDIDEQRDEIRQLLADELGGDPDDYRADAKPVADGGEK